WDCSRHMSHRWLGAQSAIARAAAARSRIERPAIDETYGANNPMRLDRFASQRANEGISRYGTTRTIAWILSLSAASCTLSAPPIDNPTTYTVLFAAVR